MKIYSSPSISFPVIRRYGITESKKAELDALTIKVLDAQYNVDQYQSIVTSLTDKVNNFQAFLAVAEATRIETYNNRALVIQLVHGADDLQSNASIAFNKMALADVKTNNLSLGVKDVIDKLIYSAEVLNKLGNWVARKKALNPLISDELVSMIATAGQDANNAVALALVALQATFAAQASNLEAESAIELAYTQSIDLYNTLTGKIVEKKTVSTPALDQLLHTAYANAKAHYVTIEQALAMATHQLSAATADLNKAQARLNSLQAGLAAANTAALAS